MTEKTQEILPFGVFRASKNPTPAPAPPPLPPPREIDRKLDDEPTTPTDQETP